MDDLSTKFAPHMMVKGFPIAWLAISARERWFPGCRGNNGSWEQWIIEHESFWKSSASLSIA